MEHQTTSLRLPLCYSNRDNANYSSNDDSHFYQCPCAQLTHFEPPRAHDDDIDTPEYSVSLTSRLWNIGSTITFSFANGNSIQHRKVLTCLSTWLQHTHLQFENVAVNGDVRIIFSPALSWSYVGINCKVVHPDRPTMQLGGIDNSDSRITAPELRSILHECGHMLGFVHEHQSPARAAQVTFDEKATVAYYADVWSPSKVERTVLHIHSEEQLAAYSPFDDMSIMLYEIPACTNREAKHIARPSTLSPIDAAFANLLYPPPLSPNLPLLKHSLSIAGVPPCRQTLILESDSPEQFRSRFMQWNREARVAYIIANNEA
ncbi:hypothetical protein QCA50_019343 [Cerrena zonata]|uniref:Peptidase M12A domain-containing protein n=1 Tax=Cerrena zonata TaxID=2478898 RepID=A0AAW0FK71_9APHY